DRSVLGDADQPQHCPRHTCPQAAAGPDAGRNGRLGLPCKPGGRSGIMAGTRGAWRRPRWSLEGPLWSLEVTVVSSRDAVTVEDLVTIEDPARYVDPFIGTQAGGIDFGHGGGAANTFPGATTPFGMVQFSPDTEVHQHGGYRYEDGRLKGFSLTHLSGPGCDDLGNLPLLPVLGDGPP